MGVPSDRVSWATFLPLCWPCGGCIGLAWRAWGPGCRPGLGLPVMRFRQRQAPGAGPGPLDTQDREDRGLERESQREAAQVREGRCGGGS